MTRHLLFVVALSCLLSSCGCDDFNLDNKHQQLLAPYHQGDTIYFSDESGMKDTIVVSKTTSWTSNCRCQANTVKIRHLPANLWIAGHDPSGAIDQSLLTVENYGVEGYAVSVDYRGFSGTITDSTLVRHDSLFTYCHQSSYYVLEDEHADQESLSQNLLHVMRVFWTAKYGLSGYQLRNGKIFRIVN